MYLYFISRSYLVLVTDGIVCDVSSSAADVCLQWQFSSIQFISSMDHYT
jgi:hypothetical protein